MAFFRLFYFFLLSLPLHAEVPSQLVFRSEPQNGYFLETEDDTYGKVTVKDDSEIYIVFADLNDNDQAYAYLNHDKNDITMKVLDENHFSLGNVIRTNSHLTGINYLIYDPQGSLQAKGKLNFVGTRIIIRDPNNHWTKFATFHRPNFKIPTRKDYWYLTIHKNERIDPRVLIMIGTLQAEIEKNNSPIRRWSLCLEE
ncbi:MAG: hypothetical protein KDK55_01100 [Chlamydiia bacterium]|nr:hypothetical protein [Chlamydiia bacterium]